ncbi:recombination regulator RecX [Alteromonas sp. ASW11-19]|uniref:Regulatory protein RecX n=1 Tax=Alteromonas salexigens TaxID=2982530 RepID=A0ABT2VPQ2_9ALTE|nr:regulatory protein RecX [Alteromonas salexigens]MCU7555054.1 recombination regulator RecX [Alteromonas salexigens]
MHEELTQDDEATIAATDRKVIIESITRMLARREHSRNEILRKLAQKGMSESDVTPVLDEFSEAGIQSDSRYAESRARALALKGSGPRKIAGDLAQHGVCELLIEEAIAAIETDWFTLAREVKEKKFGPELAEDYRARMKQMQFLQYRGFAQSHINYAVSGD